jgi:hypothetical protein
LTRYHFLATFAGVGVAAGLLGGTVLAKGTTSTKSATSISCAPNWHLAGCSGWGFKEGSWVMHLGFAKPIHIKIGEWGFEVKGYFNRPNTPLFLLVEYPHQTTRPKLLGAHTNAQGQWIAAWTASSGALSNGNGGIGWIIMKSLNGGPKKNILTEGQAAIPMQFDRNYNTVQPNAIVGSEVHDQSPILAVAGTDYVAGNTLFARLVTPKGVGTSSLELLIQRQVGVAWQAVNTKTSSSDPTSAITVDPFVIPVPGVYRVSFIRGNQLIAASDSFTVHA